MLEAVEPLTIASARKHDIADDDILHAFNHPLSYEELDDGFVKLCSAPRARRPASATRNAPRPPDRQAQRGVDTFGPHSGIRSSTGRTWPGT